MDGSVSSYRCAICRRVVPYTGRLPVFYPFCSERCKLVDLGLWFRGVYSIERDLTAEDVVPHPTAEEMPH
jgi:endogenous inhibitor of DNA gyrase (YacG/DUF329 family)